MNESSKKKNGEEKLVKLVMVMEIDPFDFEGLKEYLTTRKIKISNMIIGRQGDLFWVEKTSEESDPFE
jgi:hypothetical protein